MPADEICISYRVAAVLFLVSSFAAGSGESGIARICIIIGVVVIVALSFISSKSERYLRIYLTKLYYNWYYIS